MESAGGVRYVYMHWSFDFVFKLTPLLVYVTSYYGPGLFGVKLFLKGTISFRLFDCSLLADLLSIEFCHTIIAKNPENQKFFFIIVVYLFALWRIVGVLFFWQASYICCIQMRWPIDTTVPPPPLWPIDTSVPPPPLWSTNTLMPPPSLFEMTSAGIVPPLGRFW